MEEHNVRLGAGCEPALLRAAVTLAVVFRAEGVLSLAIDSWNEVVGWRGRAAHKRALTDVSTRQ